MAKKQDEQEKALRAFNNVFKEIISSETSYNKGLKDAVENRRKLNIPQDIFESLENNLKKSNEFLKRIKEAQRKSESIRNDLEKAREILKEMSAIYQDYMKELADGFKRHLDVQLRYEKSMRRDLQGVLILPVQRGPRHQLLFDALIREAVKVGLPNEVASITEARSAYDTILKQLAEVNLGDDVTRNIRLTLFIREAKSRVIAEQVGGVNLKQFNEVLRQKKYNAEFSREGFSRTPVIRIKDSNGHTIIKVKKKGDRVTFHLKEDPRRTQYKGTIEQALSELNNVTKLFHETIKNTSPNVAYEIKHRSLTGFQHATDEVFKTFTSNMYQNGLPLTNEMQTKYDAALKVAREKNEEELREVSSTALKEYSSLLEETERAKKVIEKTIKEAYRVGLADPRKHLEDAYSKLSSDIKTLEATMKRLREEREDVHGRMVSKLNQFNFPGSDKIRSSIETSIRTKKMELDASISILNRELDTSKNELRTIELKIDAIDPVLRTESLFGRLAREAEQLKSKIESEQIRPRRQSEWRKEAGKKQVENFDTERMSLWHKKAQYELAVKQHAELFTESEIKTLLPSREKASHVLNELNRAFEAREKNMKQMPDTRHVEPAPTTPSKHDASQEQVNKQLKEISAANKKVIEILSDLKKANNDYMQEYTSGKRKQVMRFGTLFFANTAQKYNNAVALGKEIDSLLQKANNTRIENDVTKLIDKYKEANEKTMGIFSSGGAVDDMLTKAERSLNNAKRDRPRYTE